MARGARVEVGARNVSVNGYHYIKTEDGWVLEARHIAEQQLHRPLKEDEYTTYKDGNKHNLDPSNILVRKRRQSSYDRNPARIRKQIIQKEERVKDLQDEIDYLKSELKKSEVNK